MELTGMALRLNAVCVLLLCQLVQTGVADGAGSGSGGTRAQADWLTAGLAVGTIILVLLVAAGFALWLSCRRRGQIGARRNMSLPADWTVSIPNEQITAVNEKASRKTSVTRKTSAVEAPVPAPCYDTLVPGLDQVLARHVGTSGRGHRSGRVSLPALGTPCTARNTDPTGDKAKALHTEWEPMVLLGVPGHVTPARRRSVSLRGESDEDEARDVANLPPLPPPSPVAKKTDTTLLDASSARSADEELPQRKRSVTFNRLVEEVQIMRV